MQPTRIQRYLGMLCDSETATFRVPQYKLDKLQDLRRTALDAGELSFRTPERVAGICMSLTAAIRPAALWTHAMFVVLSKLGKAGVSRIDLTHDSHADLLGELKQWRRITSTPHQGPWQWARHFTAVRTDGATDASSICWGGVVNADLGPFREGGVFLHEWLSRYIKMTYCALYHLLQQFCRMHPDALRRVQVLIDVDNQSVVGAFKRGHAKDPVTRVVDAAVRSAGS